MVKIRGFCLNNFKIELHAHSSESSRCGSIGAAELVKNYKEAGYSALVLTDHYYARLFDKISDLSWEKQLEKYLKGYKKAKKAADKLDFKIFLGIEIKFDNDPNEYLIYGSDCHEYEDLALGGIASRKLPRTVSELCDLLKSANYNLIQSGRIIWK